MKAFYIPSALLAVLFLGSLRIGSCVHQSTELWISELTAVTEFTESNLWDKAQQQVLDTHNDWQCHSDVFYTIMEHQDLDETNRLFSGVMAACREKDSVQLRIQLDQLIAQLKSLSDTQKISWKNIL